MREQEKIPMAPLEGSFSQDNSLLHSSQSHCAPSLLSQNKKVITNNTKYFKNQKLWLQEVSQCQACESFWLRPFDGMNWAGHSCSGVGSPQEGPWLFWSIVKDDLLNWSSSLRHFKWNGMSLSTSPWQLSPLRSSVCPRVRMLSSGDKWPFLLCCTWQEMFTQAGAPWCVYNNRKTQYKGRWASSALLLQAQALQDLIILQVYKFRKHGNAPVIKIIEGLIEKA